MINFCNLARFCTNFEVGTICFFFWFSHAFACFEIKDRIKLTVSELTQQHFASSLLKNRKFLFWTWTFIGSRRGFRNFSEGGVWTDFQKKFWKVCLYLFCRSTKLIFWALPNHYKDPNWTKLSAKFLTDIGCIRKLSMLKNRKFVRKKLIT